MNQKHAQKERRAKQIKKQYFSFLDHHIAEVIDGTVPQFLELNQIASALFVSHKHLTDSIQKETGNHPCHFYDLKIIEQAKKLLIETEQPIAAIARILTYDPSNFSKFFKKFTGSTPQQWRKRHS